MQYAVEYIQGHIVELHIRLQGVGVLLRGADAYIRLTVAEVHTCKPQAVHRQLSVAVESASRTLHVEPQCGIGVQVMQTHHAVGQSAVGCQRGVGRAFRHLHAHGGTGSRQTQSSAVVGMTDLGDRGIQRQVGVCTVGRKRQVNLMYIQTCAVDERLHGTA